jgi:hypothetical protein
MEEDNLKKVAYLAEIIQVYLNSGSLNVHFGIILEN